MHLQHTFELPGDVGQAIALLSRIDEIAPCLPGASATRESDDRFNGTMRVRMGPLDMSFRGVIEFTERDPAAGRVTLKSKGSEARGQGMASATTVASLTPAGNATRVVLDTDLKISGRVAQMGRGMLVEISNDLLERFVTNLKAMLADREPDAEEPESATLNSPAEAAGRLRPAAADTPVIGLPRIQEQSLNASALLWRALLRKLKRLFGLST